MSKRNSDEIRLRIDMNQANKAIKGVRHVIPTLDELRYDLNGAKVILKLNLNKGFHHLELDEDSVALQHFQHMLV